VSATASSGDGSAGDRPSKLPPALYLVATPIGNLRDITLRALDVLTAADAVACEDTRRTGRLLRAHGITASLISYHEHNAQRALPGLLSKLAAGQAIALVSDAGTPLISDPGYRLVSEAAAAGVSVIPIPGPSSVLAALTASGLPTDRFFFAGFPPAKAGARRAFFAELAKVPATLVLLESPRRIVTTCKELVAALGDRHAALARELTKLHETVLRERLSTLATRYADGPPKGEAVLVIAPPEPAAVTPDADEIDARLREALVSQSVSEAAASVAAATGMPRRALYARAVTLRQESDGAES
jgi:16S rRNA (cytidine1402-2'-O)-methyltransferase